MKVSLRHVDDMRFLAMADDHSIVVDASREDGGGGTAMSAPQLFAAAVGAYILESVLNSSRLQTVPVDQLGRGIVFKEFPVRAG